MNKKLTANSVHLNDWTADVSFISSNVWMTVVGCTTCGWQTNKSNGACRLYANRDSSASNNILVCTDTFFIIGILIDILIVDNSKTI